MFRSSASIILVSLFLSLWACSNKDKTETIKPTKKLTLSFFWGDSSFVKEKVYTNEAGNSFYVNRLQFYLSDLTLVDAQDNKHVIHGNYFVDFANGDFSINIDTFPEGDWKALEAYIGVDSLTDVQNLLPNTTENIDMQWPQGGYHYMKMEGKVWKDSLFVGYALHLGKTYTRVHAITQQNYHTRQSLALRMQMEEWFKNPVTYDILANRYIMGDSLKMKTLSNNGVDIFKIKNL